MNARTTPKTKEISKPPKIEKKPETKTNPSKPPQELPRHNSSIVAAPRPRSNLRKAPSRTHVEYPKGGKNNLRRIGLEAPFKNTTPRPIKRADMENKGIGPRGQKLLGKSSPALAGRTASTTHVGPTPSAIQSRLKKKSPWFSSIMEPIKGGGVKIPDPVGTDTGTYQHVQNVSVPVNTNGIAGLRVITPYVNNYRYGLSDGDGSNYQTTSTASTMASLNWTGPIPPYTPGNGAFAFSDIPAIMKANAQSHRVVSASVECQPEVSTLSDAGEMCAFVTPFDCNDSGVDYNSLQKQWDTSLMPVNQHKPLAARWYPLSSDFQLFNTIETVQDGNNEPSTMSYQDFIDPDYRSTTEVALDGVVPWEFGVVCTGMTPSTGVVRFRIIVNYELIPKTQTSMIQSDPSPIDPTEEQLVCGWVSDCQVTGPISQAQASAHAASSTVSERSEPSGFGMLFNVIEEMAPLIKTGLSLL